jgi:four helix bundle protein
MFYLVPMNAKSFEDLLVWQKAHAFVLEIYRVTQAFPKSELFALTSQMRRAAISVPANIAEGFKKRTRPDKIRILNIAQGSLEESQYYRILARDLNYADTSILRPQLDEVSKMLESYIHAIERNAGSPWPNRRRPGLR